MRKKYESSPDLFPLVYTQLLCKVVYTVSYITSKKFANLAILPRLFHKKAWDRHEDGHFPACKIGLKKGAEFLENDSHKLA